MNYFTIFFRTVLFYLLINLFYRIMGKREVGELSIMDLIVSMFIAEVAAISIENYKESIMLSLIPISVLVILQMLFSFITLKNNKIRESLEGKPSVIIKEGIKSIADVDYAILETSGKFSVFPKNKLDKDFPLAVILDGKIEEDTLKELSKTNAWLEKELTKQNLQLENIFYAFYKNKQLYIIEKNK